MSIGDPLWSYEIQYSSERFAKWRAGSLQYEWFMQYPGLFDGSDLEIAVSQPPAHFAEWLVAIELFRRGLNVLVEKWDSCDQHPRKCRLISAVMGSEVLTWFKDGAAGADLFVFDKRGASFFAEVKRLPDKIRNSQTDSFWAIEQYFRVPWVEIDARVGREQGLTDAQYDELISLVARRQAQLKQPLPRGDLTQPVYEVGAQRELRCHVRNGSHPAHERTAHICQAPHMWRCVSCGAVKERATVAELVRTIQELKAAVWAAGGSRRRMDRVPRENLSDEHKEMEREWHRYSRDQVELSEVL